MMVDALANPVKDRSLTDLHLFNCIRPPNQKDSSQYVESTKLPWLLKYLATKGRTADRLGCEIPLLVEKMSDNCKVMQRSVDEFGNGIVGSKLQHAYA